MKLPAAIYQLLIGFLLCLLCLQHCSSCTAINGLQKQVDECRAGRPVINVPQVTAIDTQFIHHTDTVTHTKLQPYKVIVPRVDSFVAFEPLPFDTAAFLKNYFSTAFYADTTKSEYGSIVISDTLSQNRITGRSVITDLRLPTITVTKERTVEAPKRTQVYVTLLATGSEEAPLGALGGGFLLKTKKDALWHLTSQVDAQKRLYFSLGRSWKISFKH